MTKIGVDMEKKEPPSDFVAAAVVDERQPEGVKSDTPHVVYVDARLNDAPPDYMVHSLMTLLFCCWPISLFAIMKSLASRDAASRGDRKMALVASKRAKRLNVASLVVGIVVIVLVGVAVGCVVRKIMYRRHHHPHGFEEGRFLQHFREKLGNTAGGHTGAMNGGHTGVHGAQPFHRGMMHGGRMGEHGHHGKRPDHKSSEEE